MSQLPVEHTINPECELRFELSQMIDSKNKSTILTLKLTQGTAEIFGIELTPNKEYTFREESFAVFTWHGCKLLTKTEGYLISPPPTNPTHTMSAFINAHIQLEARRDVALNNQDFGPRVLVLGNADTGKSTLCRILTAYAARLDRAPIYVDLDVTQSLLSIPGSIAAAQVDKSNISIEEGILKDSLPMVYYPGIESPISNLDYYKHMIGILSTRVKERMQKDLDAKTSGLIINTNYKLVEAQEKAHEKATDLILHIIKSFEVDIVLVINNEHLVQKFKDLQKGGHLSPTVTVDSLAVANYWMKAGSSYYINKMRDYKQNRIDKYFYGKENDLIRSKPLSFKHFQIYCARDAVSEGISAAGASSSGESRELLMPAPTSREGLQSLKGHILAILHPTPDASALTGGGSGGSAVDSSASSSSSSTTGGSLNNLTKYNIAGYLYVHEVHDDNTMTVFAPCSINQYSPRNDLPSTILFRGNVKHTFGSEKK